MKVKQLIEKLQSFDPELMVVNGGYEGGVDEALYVGSVKIQLNIHDQWYYGDHEVVDEDQPFDCEAVLIR